ncbi:UbiH/UbiF/VisC/COQ6 family ubiquinone biosynthesis hydroxylase [Paracoccus actinidiae]|uniref:UbiH/UbiF/VisC/COQ6 family ubiquinone biosynthesis hydroxylase n=1 Tax=Paracoccus actinidiae TaxID=3064531 RepID=UPI0027D2D509|nr:UbiH/UbiF/VisC/COQ6 family ubiquinone biosynthesis hydroxylase [Paracoccus sp. M09]
MDFAPRPCMIAAMELDADILIAGGGLNGPTLALALAQAGLRVIVVDPRPADARAGDNFDGRAYALAVSSQRLLKALGLWAGLAGDSQPIGQVKASQGRPGEGALPFFLHFDSAEIEEGPVGFMLEDRFLYRALLAAMRDRVQNLPGLSVVDQQATSGGIQATLSDGRSLRARLLVAADGRGSGVAARAGIRRQGWDYGQTALVAAIAHDHPHHGIAQQYFMETGPLAILPLPGNRSSVVWSETHDNARAIAALPDDAFLDVLRPRFGDYLGNISLAGARFTYPLSLSLADRYVADRVALVGDAAHGVHPIAGQGLNLGLRDVAALAEVLVDAARRGEEIGTDLVLERYQGWRRFDATSLALGMDGVNRLFGSSNPVLSAARGIGMGLVSAIPALRRGFIRQAAGLSVDPMPRLLLGQAL